MKLAMSREVADNALDQFPGPTIEARSGDEIQVAVRNNIFNDTGAGVSIHWHGLLMKGSSATAAV